MTSPSQVHDHAVASRLSSWRPGCHREQTRQLVPAGQPLEQVPVPPGAPPSEGSARGPVAP